MNPEREWRVICRGCRFHTDGAVLLQRQTWRGWGRRIVVYPGDPRHPDTREDS